MGQINSIFASFIILTMGSPKHYADTIYQQFITLDCPQGLLDSAVLQVSSFEQSLLEQERIILNLNSPSTTSGSEMGRLHAVLDPVRLLACWLEEIIYEAMVSLACLREKYLRRELAFLKDNWGGSAFFLNCNRNLHVCLCRIRHVSTIRVTKFHFTICLPWDKFTSLLNLLKAFLPRVGPRLLEWLKEEIRLCSSYIWQRVYAKVRHQHSIFDRFPVFRNKTVHFLPVDAVCWDKHGQKMSHETNKWM